MKRKRSLSCEAIIGADSGSDLDSQTNSLNEELNENVFDTIRPATSDAHDGCSRSGLPPDDSVEGKVCERCASMNLLQLFGVSNRKHDKPLVQLGLLGEHLGSESCDVCHLLDFVSHECSIHAKRTRYALCCGTNLRLSPTTNWRTILYVCCEQCGYSKGQGRDRKYDIACETTEVPSESCQQALVDKITPNEIDFQTLSGWVERCEQYDNETCAGRSESASFPKNLRLINCHTGVVVESQPGTRYSALSYVWGGSSDSSSSLYSSGDRLPSPLPLTVEDAIKVTLGLGFDYIWIDRYCIDQDDKSEKHTQIGQMHLVYQNAYVTIIAAAGQDASHGLPGVSSRPRTIRPSVRLGKFRLVAVPREPKKIIEESAWITRGWTFQEGFFAVRRLIFTEEQVSFECRKAAAHELAPKIWITWDFLKLFRDPVRKVKRPWDIRELLASYSKRKLSFQEDAINAFEGVLHDFESGKDPLTHHFGVLMMPPWFGGPRGGIRTAERTKGDRLIAGLCWRSCSEGERRANFPSWSWAGWSCEISERHPELTYGLRLDPGDVPLVVTGSSNARQRDDQNSTETEQWLDSIGNCLTLEVWVIALRLWDTTTLEDELSLLLHDVDKVYALFENEQYMMRVEADFICRPDEMELPRQGSLQAFGAKNIFGALLSDCTSEDGSHRGGLFFLIIERTGQGFRRIGHLFIDHDRAKVISKRNATGKRQFIGWEEIPIEERRQLLLGSRERMTIQIL